MNQANLWANLGLLLGSLYFLARPLVAAGVGAAAGWMSGQVYVPGRTPEFVDIPPQFVEYELARSKADLQTVQALLEKELQSTDPETLRKFEAKYVR